MLTKTERQIREALRERAITFNQTAPMQARKEGMVRSFMRNLGNKYVRIKAHVRRNKGKYLLAGAVGAAGAAMLHRAARVESPKYNKFVTRHTDGFMKGAASAVKAVGLKLAPHYKAYARDAKWLGKKARPLTKAAGAWPRMTMLLGGLAAERAHKFVKAHSPRYRDWSKRMGKKVSDYINDSYLLTSAKTELEDQLGRRLGRTAARSISSHADDAIMDATNYGYRVARGVTNPFIPERTEEETAAEQTKERRRRRANK